MLATGVPLNALLTALDAFRRRLAATPVMLAAPPSRSRFPPASPSACGACRSTTSMPTPIAPSTRRRPVAAIASASPFRRSLPWPAAPSARPGRRATTNVRLARWTAPVGLIPPTARRASALRSPAAHAPPRRVLRRLPPPRDESPSARRPRGAARRGHGAAHRPVASA